MVRYLLIIALAFCASAPLLAQEDGSKAIPRKHTLRTFMTVTPGYLTHRKLSTMYVHNNLEYFSTSHFAIRSDSFIYLSTLDDDKRITQNHQGYLGAAYHFYSGGAFTPYIGLQPGFVAFQTVENGVQNDYRLTPLVSPFVGFIFWGASFFHFDMSVRYNYGQVFDSTLGSISIGEWKVSFGLGIHVTLD